MSSLKVKKLYPQAILPTRGTKFSIGYDLFLPTDFLLLPGVNILPIGISVAIPEGHYGRIAPRSSLSLNGVNVGAGVVDADYRGEIKVCLFALHTLSLKEGDKIAQLILEKASILPVEEVNCLDETERGESGFGSTGR